MRYLDIKPAVCVCCLPGLLEDSGEFGLQFDRSRFYANMRALQASGITSDLEGVDTMVRLGYLEKADSAEIFDRFGVEHPLASAGRYGSFNSTRDDIRMAYDVLFTPNSLGSGTSTLAHELRHRAFHIISVTPELESRMPQELRGRWADGYGAHQLGVDRWRVSGAFASPEHAMIYAVQHRNIPEDRQEFFNNPALGGESVGYWRDLYTQVESAVSSWLESRVQVQEPEDQPEPTAQSSLSLSPEMQTFFTSLQRIHNRTRLNLYYILKDLQLALLEAWFNTQNSELLTTNGYITDYKFSQVETPLMSWISSQEFSELDTQLQTRIRKAIQDFNSVGISWRILDPRTFTQAEFDAMIQLRPELVPAVPVATVNPLPAPQTPAPTRGTAAASPTEPETAPTVAPTGNSIGFYQFTASTRIHPNHTPTLWSTVTGTNNLKGLQGAINGPIALRMSDAGLTFDGAAQAQLQALYRILQTDGYDSALVAQMLARIVLVKG